MLRIICIARHIAAVERRAVVGRQREAALQTARQVRIGNEDAAERNRVGNDTMKAVKDYQTKMGLLPADGYGGLKVLARLRQGG